MAKKRNKFTTKWTVEIEVDNIWIQDGFNLDPDTLQEAILSHCLGYAYPDEVKVRILKKPTQKQLDNALTEED